MRPRGAWILVARRIAKNSLPENVQNPTIEALIAIRFFARAPQVDPAPHFPPEAHLFGGHFICAHWKRQNALTVTGVGLRRARQPVSGCLTVTVVPCNNAPDASLSVPMTSAVESCPQTGQFPNVINTRTAATNLGSA
jgi:hypothetical protein